MLEVKKTKSMGRGVFATQDIKSGAKISEAEFLEVLDEQVNLCPDLAKYVFAYSNRYSALCLGIGSLFNHSDKPSAEASFGEKDGRDIMEFWTVRNIKSGEEIFINYGGENYAFNHLLKNEKDNHS